jgi:predicted nucleic acid-binding protein
VILVDTSVWVRHLRVADGTLVALLDAGQVLGHPFVTGELALGNLRRRNLVIGSLLDLPQASMATNDEVLQFIHRYSLHGIGIGYVDAHLLAAVRLSPDAALWTQDKALQAAADRLGLAWHARRE